MPKRKASTASSKRSKSSSISLRFDDGAVQFRQRIVVAILSNRPLLLRNIRPDDLEAPGLRPYEASFLRLIDNVTNGTSIEINTTGTQLRFKPGVLTGGEIRHECSVGNADEEGDISNKYRPIGWYMEGILPLAPFGKEGLSIQFTGITDGLTNVAPSCDYWRASALPILSLFGIGQSVDATGIDFLGPSSPSIRILTRGAAPAGGGTVHFYCPMVPQELKPIDLTDPGKVKRIRGTSITTKVVSSSLAARAAYTSKGVLQRLIPDIWIHTDVHTIKNHHCGPSPGLNVVLSAESNTGVIYTAESMWQHQKGEIRGPRELPEDVGQRVACLLLEEVKRGGCIDTGMQSLVLLWMCLTPEDVSRIRIGSLSSYTIASLRLFRQVFGVEFKLTPDEETKTIILSCLGTGYSNMARART